MSQELYTLREAADQLRIHPKTLTMYARRGEIASFRVGLGAKSPYRFTQEHIDEFLASRYTPKRRYQY